MLSSPLFVDSDNNNNSNNSNNNNNNNDSDDDEDDEVERLLSQGPALSQKSCGSASAPSSPMTTTTSVISNSQGSSCSCSSSNNRNGNRNSRNRKRNNRTRPNNNYYNNNKDEDETPKTEGCAESKGRRKNKAKEELVSSSSSLTPEQIEQAHKTARMFVTNGLDLKLVRPDDLVWYRSKSLLLPGYVLPSTDVRQHVGGKTKGQDCLVQPLVGTKHSWRGYSVAATRKTLPPYHNYEKPNHPCSKPSESTTTTIFNTASNPDPDPTDLLPVWSPKLIKEYLNKIKSQKEFKEGNLAVNLMVEQLILPYVLEQVRAQERDRQQAERAATKVEQSDVHDEEEQENDDEEEEKEDFITTTMEESSNVPPDRGFAVPRGKKMKLRAGDVIMYVPETKVCCRENMRQAAIVQVYAPSNASTLSSTQNHHSEFALELSDGQYLTMDAQVKIVQRWIREKWVDYAEGSFRLVSDCALDASNNDKFRVDKSSTLAAQMHAKLQETQNAMKDEMDKMLQEEENQPSRQSQEQQQQESSSKNPTTTYSSINDQAK